MSSSVGMMKFPIYGKKNVPNHQPEYHQPEYHFHDFDHFWPIPIYDLFQNEGYPKLNGFTCRFADQLTSLNATDILVKPHVFFEWVGSSLILDGFGTHV